jgi:hypothetical protein
MLGDELHLTAVRIRRICSRPEPEPAGADGHLGLGRARRRGALDHRLAILGQAAEELADLVADLHPSEWSLVGRVGARHLSVADLVLLPLHRSHSRLERERRCA